MSMDIEPTEFRVSGKYTRLTVKKDERSDNWKVISSVTIIRTGIASSDRAKRLASAYITAMDEAFELRADAQRIENEANKALKEADSWDATE